MKNGVKYAQKLHSVGYPGETEADFERLLHFLKEARLDRVGAFKYSPVEGAAANQLDDPVPEAIKQERYDRFMRLQQEISQEKLQQKIGQTIPVIIDIAEKDNIVGRTMADAPEIDGVVYVTSSSSRMIPPGEIISVTITHANEYDLWGEMVNKIRL